MAKTEKPPLRMEWVDPNTLDDNPQNWRTHPESQMAALGDVLGDPEIGWAGVLLYNERTRRLIDGHARKKAALARGDKAVPVVIGSWSEAAEKKILLTLDPLAGMAEADPEQLEQLLAEVDVGTESLRRMLEDLTPESVIEFDEAPETIQKNVEEMEQFKAARKAENEKLHERNDTERYLVLVFPNREAKQKVAESLGLPEDERYIPAERLDIRPKQKLKAVKGGDRSIKSAPVGNAGACG